MKNKVFFLFLFFGVSVFADQPKSMDGVGVEEHLGAEVEIQSLEFKNEQGKTVKLSEYFNKQKPVLLALVYYECPSLCGFLLNGLLDGLKEMDYSIGKQFEMVTVSINPKETPELALAKKKNFLESYGRKDSQEGWHFLTGEENQIKKLAKSVGFGYRYDKEEKEFFHSAVVMVLTPSGKISRYLYGVRFPARDIRLSLLEASSGKVGTVVDRFILFCYRYDSQTRGYALHATRLMKAGSATTTVLFGGYLLVFWRRQKKRKGA